MATGTGHAVDLFLLEEKSLNPARGVRRSRSRSLNPNPGSSPIDAQGAASQRRKYLFHNRYEVMKKKNGMR